VCRVSIEALLAAGAFSPILAAAVRDGTWSLLRPRGHSSSRPRGLFHGAYRLPMAWTWAWRVYIQGYRLLCVCAVCSWIFAAICGPITDCLGLPSRCKHLVGLAPPLTDKDKYRNGCDHASYFTVKVFERSCDANEPREVQRIRGKIRRVRASVTVQDKITPQAQVDSLARQAGGRGAPRGTCAMLGLLSRTNEIEHLHKAKRGIWLGPVRFQGEMSIETPACWPMSGWVKF